MKINKLYIFLFVGFLVFLCTTAYYVQDKASREKLNTIFGMHSDKGTDNSQIIKFNHKVHVKDNGVKCEDCHNSVTTSTSAKDDLLPLQETCAGCHDVKDEKNCNYCHFDNNYKKLVPTVNELNFSHKYHVETQKKACIECHSGLDTVKYSKESAAAFPKMETCYSCHNNKTSVNYCEGCHTNLTGRKPDSHRDPNFLNEHKVVADVSNEKNKYNCMMCHTDNFCQVCHSPVGYTGTNSKNNFFVPYYTKEGATRMDRASLQKLSTVHDMNYRFTHGLDANNKTFECKTCHDVQTFCVDCHQNGGEELTGVAPMSHRQPNFTTIGVNTGGGLHADLAKRDIESCQSCHDTQGGDPVCIKCHIDNDGVQGTNPKTHESGFMHNENGIWHQTQGAICYTCHVDPNARPNGIKGVGFCGYCHGR